MFMAVPLTLVAKRRLEGQLETHWIAALPGDLDTESEAASEGT